MTPCLCTGRTDVACDQARCSIAGPGAPGDRDSCRVCWLRLRKRGEILARFAPAPCEHLGAPTGESAECKGCGLSGRTSPVRSCALHGRCTTDFSADLGGARLACCRHCPDRSAWPRRFDEKNLWPGVPGLRFNPSILSYESGYLLAARNGWAGSEIYLGRLDADFRPVGEPWRLELYHRDAAYGREDPRLFWHAGRVHVAYAGVVGGTKPRHTNVLLARLGADLRVERIFHPQIPGRAPDAWEKNHAYFSHDGELYCVYSVSPHRILRIDGDRAEFIACEENHLPWPGGERRGGAPPALAGGEYWHFAHDRVPHAGRWRYRTLLYTFSAAPPFRPLRHIPEPILEADLHDRPGDQYAFVAFCCGAARAGDWWVLSHGRQDRWVTLDRFPHAELERRLVSA